jgi:hypothetical protein
MLKAICGLSLPLLLSACGTTSQMQMRSYYSTGAAYDFAPTGFTEPRLLDSHFYMDDDVTPRWLLMTTRPIR